MYDYPELTQARNDMRVQDEFYQPTAFWHEASSEIVLEICTHGVERFRSLETALGFFVPTYGNPGGGFNSQQSEGCEVGSRPNGPMRPSHYLHSINF